MPPDMTAIYDAARFRFSNPISVVLTRPQSYSGGAQTSVTVNNVQRQPAAEQEVESAGGGSLEGERRAYRLWLVECLALPPHKGYLIIDPDGSTWEVTSVDKLSKGRQFRCHASKRPS